MQPPKVNTPNSVVHNRVGTVQQVPGHQTWSAVVQGVLLLKSWKYLIFFCFLDLTWSAEQLFFFPWIFFFTPKKCLYENWRAPPPSPLTWWIFFLYLSIRGLLLWTILCLLFRNRRKIERFFFFKEEVWNLKIGGGEQKFFLKSRQSLNFPQISKWMGPTCS